MKEYSVLGYISGTPIRGSVHRGTTKQHAMKLMLTVSPCGSQRINEVALPLHQTKCECWTAGIVSRP